MTTHLDLVKNDLTNRQQRRLGYVVHENGEFHAKDMSHHLADEVYRRAEAIDADDALSALRALMVLLDGSRMFATAPHEEAECPFAESDVVPMGAAEAGPLVIPV